MTEGKKRAPFQFEPTLPRALGLSREYFKEDYEKALGIEDTSIKEEERQLDKLFGLDKKEQPVKLKEKEKELKADLGVIPIQVCTLLGIILNALSS